MNVGFLRLRFKKSSFFNGFEQNVKIRLLWQYLALGYKPISLNTLFCDLQKNVGSCIFPITIQLLHNKSLENTFFSRDLLYKNATILS
jgi:hypothetical protein